MERHSEGIRTNGDDSRSEETGLMPVKTRQKKSIGELVLLWGGRIQIWGNKAASTMSTQMRVLALKRPKVTASGLQMARNISFDYLSLSRMCVHALVCVPRVSSSFTLPLSFEVGSHP